MGTDLSLGGVRTFIGLLQALIFTLLTMVYFGLAAGPDEEDQRLDRRTA
jgi:F0F1-type ATP synthase membrane subunit a